MALIVVIPDERPAREATKDLVRGIRDRAPRSRSDRGRRDRSPADRRQHRHLRQARRRPAAVPGVVVGLALILLLLVFRSIAGPAQGRPWASCSASRPTFGVVVAVFQWGWLGDLFGVDQTGPIVSLLPILLIGVVFGLAMDYEVFLVSRMREELRPRREPAQAVVTGFRHSARVVTAAAIIMVSVFSGFLLGDDVVIKSIGFGLAVGVFVDAFVVRMTIVPAVMALLGHRAWWLPRWLDRILPNVDVEGEKLRQALEADEPEPEKEPEPVMS